MTTRKTPKPAGRRNLAALAPILRKGHVHGPSRSALRSRDKMRLRKDPDGQEARRGSRIGIAVLNLAFLSGVRPS